MIAHSIARPAAPRRPIRSDQAGPPVQKVRLPPTCTRVEAPMPRATATLNRTNAAVNQTLPPTPRFSG